jgi:hypothetical protein
VGFKGLGLREFKVLGFWVLDLGILEFRIWGSGFRV